MARLLHSHSNTSQGSHSMVRKQLQFLNLPGYYDYQKDVLVMPKVQGGTELCSKMPSPPKNFLLLVVVLQHKRHSKITNGPTLLNKKSSFILVQTSWSAIFFILYNKIGRWVCLAGILTISHFFGPPDFREYSTHHRQILLPLSLIRPLKPSVFARVVLEDFISMFTFLASAKVRFNHA